MELPCSMCGCCCRSIDVAVKSVEELGIDIEKFPYHWNEKGECEMLVGNKCSVYENRPTLCNTGKMRVFFEMSDEQFLSLNKAACNKMIVESGMDEKYLLK